MSQVILFGASGGTGRLVMEQALHAGHHVTVVVRNSSSLTMKHERLQLVQGDVFHPDTFQKYLDRKDAVISCLGVQSREPTTVYSQGITNIIQAMNEYKVKRILCLSAGAVIVPPKGSVMTRFFIKNVLQKIFANLYSDMFVMEGILTLTDLDYTIIRAPWLRDSKPKGHYRFSINDHLDHPSKISRADLAEFIVSHLTDEKTHKTMVDISY